MKQSIGLAALVMRNHNEAIDFYVQTLGFSLIEDIYVPEQDKRGVVRGEEMKRMLAVGGTLIRLYLEEV